MNTAQFAVNLMTYRDTIKVYHWTTLSYSRHKATCTLVDKMDDLIDTLVETYSARYGRPNFDSMSIKINKQSDESARRYLLSFIHWLEKDFESFVNKKNDTDLLNTRDSLLGEIQQTLYLFDLS